MLISFMPRNGYYNAFDFDPPRSVYSAHRTVLATLIEIVY